MEHQALNTKQWINVKHSTESYPINAVIIEIYDNQNINIAYLSHDGKATTQDAILENNEWIIKNEGGDYGGYVKDNYILSMLKKGRSYI